jgi:hypothetical protein
VDLWIRKALNAVSYAVRVCDDASYPIVILDQQNSFNVMRDPIWIRSFVVPDTASSVTTEHHTSEFSSPEKIFIPILLLLTRIALIVHIFALKTCQ